LKQIKIYTQQNAVEFLDYARIYDHERIKKTIQHMYSDRAFAVGLNIGEFPVGFISAFRRDENNWLCDQPFVRIAHRNNGYDKQLLSQCIQEIEQRSVENLYFKYTQNDKKSKSLVELFTSFGFKPSGYTRKVFIIPKSEIEHFKTMVDKDYARYLKMQNGKVMKRFCELTGEEKDQLTIQKGNAYPELYDPFLTDDIDLALSRIIYKNGDPAAWIAYRILGKTALYVDRFYVKERYRSHGLFFPLFYDTYLNTPEKIKKLVLYMNGTNNKMLRLFRIFKVCKKTEDTTIELIKPFNAKKS